MRTIELFRSCGIEAEVRVQSEKEFTPEGAIVAVESLAGKQIAAFIPSLNEGVDALSPCRRLFVTQPGLEPILRRRAEQAGAQIADGLEVINVEQKEESVTVLATDVESGQQRHFTGQYLTAPTARIAKYASLSIYHSTGAAFFPIALRFIFTPILRGLWLVGHGALSTSLTRR
jgi:L-2-hydroxyglutarate oxidase LhgO